MTTIQCPHCHTTFNHPTEQVQQILYTPPVIKKPTEIFWEDSETRTGKPCKKAYAHKNIYRNYPITAYLELKRKIEIIKDENGTGGASINGDWYFIGKDYIGKMESNYQ